MSKVQSKRHIAKTISWRLVGTMDTIMLSWLVTGNPFTSLKIGLTEPVTKMILYYLHERIWFRFDLNNTLKKSRNRHLVKTVSWRLVGTTDTVILGWIFSGNPWTGLQIGGYELATKMLLYYVHERLWFKSSFGIVEDAESDKEPEREYSDQKK